MSADPEQDYFSDGLTDEVIADLSGIRALRVISRTSAMRFKGTDKDLRTVARELNVRYVLQGTVRRVGANLRVTIQLVDPETDSNIWAHKYSGSIDDVFGIQEEISRKIVDALRMQLSPEEDKKLAERPFDNVKAFECYHRAQREIYTFTLAGLDLALELIQDALRIVGDNELLYAAMGGIYRQYVNAALKSDDGYIASAEECADKVFTLSPDSAVGHELLGKIRLTQGRPAEGIRHLRRALELQPNIVHAWNELHRVYDVVGWHDEARALAARARILDPLSPIIRALPLFNQLLDGHPDVVERNASEALGLFPGFSMMRWTCAMALIHRAKPREALELLEAAPQGDETIAGRLCVFLQRALEDRPDQAMAAVSTELLARARPIEWWSWWVAEGYAFIGEETMAIAWLESAFERGFMNYRYLSTHSPVFRKLDGNPAFRELLGRIKTRAEQFEV
jgi:TolB-like protein